MGTGGKKDTADRKSADAGYENAELGFALVWDQDVFEAEEIASDDAGYGVELQSPATYAYIVGFPFEVAAADCLEVLASNVDKTFENTKIASKKYDRPATDKAAEGELYTFLGDDGETKMIGYLECREILDGAAVLSVQISTEVASYEDELGVWEDLLGGIEVGSGSSNGGNEEESSEPSLDGTVIEAPGFGFQMTIDESVWTVEDVSDGETASFDFESEMGTGYVVAVASGAGAQECLDTVAANQADRTDVIDFGSASRKMARPETSRDAVGDLFAYTFDSSSGPVEAVNYIECRELVPGESILVFSFTTAAVIYEDALPMVEELLAGIQING